MKRIWTVLPVSLLLSLTLVPDVSAQTCRDSIIASTPASNFTIHNDGTVTHNTTGLMWMRCSLGQIWDGKACSGTAIGLSWQSALENAVGLSFGGYDDWRVPNRSELESILEERCNSPAINLAVFPATPSSYFWTSSPYAGLSHGAWSIDFGYGSVNATVKSGRIHARFVRGGD